MHPASKIQVRFSNDYLEIIAFDGTIEHDGREFLNITHQFGIKFSDGFNIKDMISILHKNVDRLDDLKEDEMFHFRLAPDPQQ